MSELGSLVERYVAAWNEPDPMRRRERVAGLWHETAVRYNHANQQIGREAIAQAVTSTYQRFGANGYRFRALNSGVGHHNAAKFNWEMLTPRGEIDSIGTTFLVLNCQRQVVLDYQFTEGPPPS